MTERANTCTFLRCITRHCGPAGGLYRRPGGRLAGVCLL